MACKSLSYLGLLEDSGEMSWSLPEKVNHASHSYFLPLEGETQTLVISSVKYLFGII